MQLISWIQYQQNACLIYTSDKHVLGRVQRNRTKEKRETWYAGNYRPFFLTKFVTGLCIINEKKTKIKDYIHWKQTFILDDFIFWFNWEELIRDDLFSEELLIKTCVVITTFGKGWFAARRIRDNEALANLVKLSCSRKKKLIYNNVVPILSPEMNIINLL